MCSATGHAKSLWDNGLRPSLTVLAVSVPARSAEAAPVTLDQVVLPTGGGLGSIALAQTFTVASRSSRWIDVAAWSGDPFVESHLLAQPQPARR